MNTPKSLARCGNQTINKINMGLPVSDLVSKIKDEIYEKIHGYERDYVERAVLFKTYSSDERIDPEEKKFLLRVPSGFTEEDRNWKIYVLNNQTYELINNYNRLHILEAQLEYAADKSLFLNFMEEHLTDLLYKISDVEKKKIEKCLTWLNTKKGELFGISSNLEEQEFSENLKDTSDLIEVNLIGKNDKDIKQFRIKLIRLIDFLSTGTDYEEVDKRKKLGLLTLKGNSFINLLRNIQFFNKKGLIDEISESRRVFNKKEMENFNFESKDPFPKYMQETLVRYFNEKAYIAKR